MTRTAISTEHAPAAIGPYSQAVRVGDMIFCSGQIALDPSTGQMVGGGDVRAETEQVMKNIAAVLAAAGGNYSNVVKGTIFLTDLSDFHHVGEIYGACFSEGDPPARSCVQVSALPRGATVEIEIIAHIPE